MVEVPRWGTVIVSALLMTSHVLRNRRTADRPEHGRPAVRAPALTGRRATSAAAGDRRRQGKPDRVRQRLVGQQKAADGAEPPVRAARDLEEAAAPAIAPDRCAEVEAEARHGVGPRRPSPGGPVQPTNKPAGALRTLPSVVRALRRAGRSARRQTTT